MKVLFSAVYDCIKSVIREIYVVVMDRLRRNKNDLNI